MEQEMLPDRLDALEHAAVDRSRDTRRLALRVRARRLDPLADERLEPRGRAAERITLRHRLESCGQDGVL
jgi:hypothetical protein